MVVRHRAVSRNHVDEILADAEASLDELVDEPVDQAILFGEGLIRRVLITRVDEPISDGNSLEVDGKRVLVLETEVMRDGRDVVAGV